MLKAIGFILIIAGLADLAMVFLFSNDGMGWTDHLFGQFSVVATYGPWAMIGIGGWMIRGGSDDGEE